MQKSNNILRRFFAFLKFKKKPHFAQEDIEKYIKRIRRNTKNSKKRKGEIEIAFLKVIKLYPTSSLLDIYDYVIANVHLNPSLKVYRKIRTKGFIGKKRNAKK